MTPVEVNEVDRRIWEEELDEFVPRQIYDAHTHIWRWVHNTDPAKESGAFRKIVKPEWEEASYALADRCDELLMPGRTVHRLAFPFPFPQCDFTATNRYVSEQVAGRRPSGSLMLVRPGMRADE